MIEAALILQVVIWLAVVVYFLGSGRASIFHPAAYYIAFHGLVFVVRPLLVHFMGFRSIWDYMVFEPDEKHLVVTLAATSLGLVAIVASSLLIGRTRPGFDGAPAPSVSPLQYRALVWTTLILLPLIAYSIYSTRGGAEVSGERAENGVFIQTHSTGYINDAQFFIAPLLCAWLVATRFHWRNLIPIVLYVAYRSWVGWSRWTILLFFLMVSIQFCWYRRLRWLPLWSAALAVPVLMLFNVLGHNRDLLKDFFTGQQSWEQENVQRLGMSAEEKRNLRYDTQDFANFDYLAVIISIVPEQTGSYTYGLQYLQLFTEPIPRILWSGKPTGAPVSLFNLGDYANFLGLTLSLAGDGWMSGGWFGVIITMGIAGSVMGLGYEWLWRNRANAILPLFYITFLGISPNWFRDGGISVFKFILFTWFPLLVWLGVIWWMESRPVPGTSVILRPGDSLRIVQLGRTDGALPAATTILLRHPNVQNPRGDSV